MTATILSAISGCAFSGRAEPMLAPMQIVISLPVGAGTQRVAPMSPVTTLRFMRGHRRTPDVDGRGRALEGTGTSAAAGGGVSSPAPVAVLIMLGVNSPILGTAPLRALRSRGGSALP